MLHFFTPPAEAKMRVSQENSSEGPGFLEGYASVFGIVDAGGDVVIKGAFAKTLKDGLKQGEIKLCDSHMIAAGAAAIIGLVTEAEEDDFGLKFRAKFSAVPRAQDVRTKIQEEILNALSFGYEIVNAVEDKKTKSRHLLEVRLFEISVVPWGMNPKARIEAVKADDESSPEFKALLASITQEAASLEARRLCNSASF